MPKYKGYTIKGFWYWMAYCIGLGTIFSVRHIIFLPLTVGLGLLAMKWMLDKEVKARTGFEEG